MNSLLRVQLSISPEQKTSLLALQVAFSQVCNALAPVVQETRCWNRVALHHMTYKSLRERFPAMGSQMVCNAIYSVCRASRLVYQHPKSPFNANKLGVKALPLLRFADSCPVYFDRHTLSLKGGRLSLFTLDGRMKFLLDLQPEYEAAFHEKKLREIVLSRRSDGEFELAFAFETTDVVEPVPAVESAGIPEYVMVEENE